VEPSGISVTCTASGSEIVAVVGSSLNVILIQLNIPGFINPPTTAVTSSFTIYTTSASDVVLDEKTSGVTMTATVGSLTGKYTYLIPNSCIYDFSFKCSCCDQYSNISNNFSS
jgi:hypothetical protein